MSARNQANEVAVPRGSGTGGGRPISASKGGGESHTWLSPGDMEGIGRPPAVPAKAPAKALTTTTAVHGA
jgi:hypothetical protein